jgi:hypothetical protein
MPDPSFADILASGGSIAPKRDPLMGRAQRFAGAQKPLGPLADIFATGQEVTPEGRLPADPWAGQAPPPGPTPPGTGTEDLPPEWIHQMYLSKLGQEGRGLPPDEWGPQLAAQGLQEGGAARFMGSVPSPDVGVDQELQMFAEQGGVEDAPPRVPGPTPPGAPPMGAPPMGRRGLPRPPARAGLGGRGQDIQNVLQKYLRGGR